MSVLLQAGLLLRILLKPVLLNRRGTALRRRSTLNLDNLGVVRLQVVGNVALFRRRRGLGNGELVDVALGIGGLDLRGLVGLQLAEVQVLDKIGWIVNWVSGGLLRDAACYSPWRTAVGTMKVRRATRAGVWRATRASVWRCNGVRNGQRGERRFGIPRP
jgi:hypothetical protein